jgi:hypothetical protein
MSDYLAGIGAFEAWEEHVKSGEVYTIDEVYAINNLECLRSLFC